MLELTFRQTGAEMMVRIASTLLFDVLSRSGCPSVPLSELSEKPQYGFTARASRDEVGPKFVRITDLADEGINWDAVPHCLCDRPERYILSHGDILFARTPGATTGKTHLISQAPYAVFASYLIRVRAKGRVLPEYLHSFFQSDAYWLQILEEKKGSAQPNVNGRKLMKIQVPAVDDETQLAISRFLETVGACQRGSGEKLPELPSPLSGERRVVVRIEELAALIEEAQGLRVKAREEAAALLSSVLDEVFGQVSPTAGRYPFRPDWRNYGKSFLVRECPEAVLASYLIRLRLKPVLEPEYLYWFFQSPQYWAQVFEEKKGSTQANMNASKLSNVVVPVLLNIEERSRIVAHLDDLQAQVDELTALQDATQAELDALLPSVLDQAFRGEL